MVYSAAYDARYSKRTFTESMNIEEAFKKVGDIGVYQNRVFWSTAVPQIFIAWLHLLNIFVGAIPDFYCYLKNPVENQFKLVNKCSSNTTYNPCIEYVFNNEEFTSIASEWDLVCDSAYMTDLVQSLFMVGLLTGNLIGGWMADQYGRKPTCCVGSFGFLVFGLLSTFATSYRSYLFLRFLTGVFTGSYGLISYTFAAEMVGATYRGYVNFINAVTFAVGVASLSLMAFYIRDWRLLSLITSLPGLLSIYYYYCIVESPRWLYSQNRVTEAQLILNVMQKANKILLYHSHNFPHANISLFDSSKCGQYVLNFFRYIYIFIYLSWFSSNERSSDVAKNISRRKITDELLPTNSDVGISDMDSDQELERDQLYLPNYHNVTYDQNQPDPSVINNPNLIGEVIVLKPRSGASSEKVVYSTKWRDILSSKQLIRITLVNMLSWLIVNTTYYGLTLKMGDLNGNRYLNVAFSGFVEIPASFLTLYFMDKYGRKITFTTSLYVSGMLTFVVGFMTQATPYTSVTLALLGKTMISIGVGVCWMHATEMYPTNIRNKALSLCSMCGRLGGVCAPLVLSLGRMTEGRDFVVFGISCLISGFFSTYLPETLNQRLPETIEDMVFNV